jgi:hypothetical protein
LTIPPTDPDRTRWFSEQLGHEAGPPANCNASTGALVPRPMNLNDGMRRRRPAAHSVRGRRLNGGWLGRRDELEGDARQFRKPLYGVLQPYEAELVNLWVRRTPTLVPSLDTSAILWKIGCKASDLATWEEIDRGVGYLLLESMDARHWHRPPPKIAFLAPLLFRVAVSFPECPPGSFLEHRRVWVPEHDRWALTISYLAPGPLRTSIACAHVSHAEWGDDSVRAGYCAWWNRLKAAQPTLAFGHMSERGIVQPHLAWELLRGVWPQAANQEGKQA